MKLSHKIEDTFETSDSENIGHELEILRKIEDKFYKVFDLNPCPMAICDYDTHKIIDVNDAFLKIMEFENKNEIIGQDTSDKKLIDRELKYEMYSIIKKGDLFKNIIIQFQSKNGKKYKGLFSGSVIELNGRQCIFTICQIINRKCFYKVLFDFLK
jgi:PAS domain-containing protein